MSFLRKLATYLLSSLFVMLAFTMVTSYAIGNSIQKENIKIFIKSQLSSELATQQCDSICSNVTETSLKATCLDECLDRFSNESEEVINKVVDDIYNKKFMNISINEAASLLSNFFLFFILTIISGIALFFVSENPLTTLGKNSISISISLFIFGFLPNLIPLPAIPAVRVMFDYLSSGLSQQIYFGIIFLVIGIVFLIANYIKKRKITSPLLRTSQKKLSQPPSRSRS